MPSILKFYGNHNLEFVSTSHSDITRFITWEMRHLDIPNFDDIMLLSYDKIRLESPQYLWAVQFEINEWCPLSIPEIPALEGKIRNVAMIGPMGLLIWFTPYHIELSSPINDHIAWYSPENRESVSLLRNYFHTVINHFGGDKALYISEAQADKYYNKTPDAPGEALNNLVKTLTAKYGVNKKSLFDFSTGKFPKYYIDDFSDIR